MNKTLPIGSVININNKKRKYVIVGKDIFFNNIKYDYMCVMYPCGYYKDCKFLYFNDKDVKSICNIGDLNG